MAIAGLCGLSALLVCACGGQSSRGGVAPAPEPLPCSGPSCHPGPYPTITPTPVPTENPLPPIMETFTITGSLGTQPVASVEVDTDNLLKVKITPGAAGPLADPNQSSNFTANYGCVSYTITVLGRTEHPTLRVGAGSPACPGAPESYTIDFSNRLSPGHNSVTVQVSNPRYDFYYLSCVPQPWLYGVSPYQPFYYIESECRTKYGMYNVYKNHTVTGTLEIQVNTTSL